MPRSFEDGRRQIRGIHLDADLARRLDDYARRQGIGREVIVETALRHYFAEIVAANLAAQATLAELNREPVGAPVPPDPGSG